MAKKPLFRRHPWTTEEFIELARKVYGDKFDYSLVNLEKNHKFLRLICNECGGVIPTATPQDVLDGKVRHRCSMTTERFIREARKVHGDRYDYSETEVIKGEKKVKIICRIHGPFWQAIYDHLNGRGCKRCTLKYPPKTTEQFIEEAEAVHGKGTYDYSLTKYKNNEEKLCVICHKIGRDGKEHGKIWVVPKYHLAGRKCYKCARDEKANKFIQICADEFVRKATELYGDMYDYSQMKYVDMDTKTKFVCKKHGIFWRTPRELLSGKKCQHCASRTITKEEFYEEAEKLSDKYEIPQNCFRGPFNHIKIGCPKHGSVETTPRDLVDYGCPLCRLEAMTDFCNGLFEENGIEYEQSKTFYWMEGETYNYFLPKYNVLIKFIRKKQSATASKKENRTCEDHFMRLYCILYYNDYEEEVRKIVEDAKEGMLE